MENTTEPTNPFATLFRIEEFKEYAIDKFKKNYLQFYSSEDEYRVHFLSGEVKISFTDMIKVVDDYRMALETCYEGNKK